VRGEEGKGAEYVFISAVHSEKEGIIMQEMRMDGWMDGRKGDRMKGKRPKEMACKGWSMFFVLLLPGMRPTRAWLD
jgi:hypothetical protein